MKNAIAILAAIIVALASGPAFASAKGVTIAQLLANPAQYRFAEVIVRGQIDNCVGFSCNLCPEDMTRATFDVEKCISLDFDNYDNRQSERESIQDVLANAFRFSVVTVHAWYDPRAELGEVLVTDKATGLYGARVLEIHARKTLRDGLVSFYSYGDLAPAPGDEVRGMLQAMSRDGAIPYLATKATLFLIKGKDHLEQPDRVELSGLGCTCFIEDCSKFYPDHMFEGMETAQNIFHCERLVKVNGRWWPVPWF